MKCFNEDQKILSTYPQCEECKCVDKQCEQ